MKVKRLSMSKQRLRDAKDAARYRFWRKHWTAKDEDDFDKLNDILGKADVNTPAQVDAALDAAMLEQSGDHSPR